jgi:cytidyltransferase-like protein
MSSNSFSSRKIPPLGPEPTLLSRKQVDALYEMLQAVKDAMETLEVPYIITSGGTLLGAVRQHSILFCDDDIDLAVLETKPGNYKQVQDRLPSLLGSDFSYTKEAWECSDRIRFKKVPNVFIDLFCIRKYEVEEELRIVLGRKKNGQKQTAEYVDQILQSIRTAAFAQGEKRPLFPFWHFHSRKAIELWPKEVYREQELFPINTSYKMGPLGNLSGPRMPVLLLNRAFGDDCFHVYYPSHGHDKSNDKLHHICTENLETVTSFKPLVHTGGTWLHNPRSPLLDEHYIPMQPLSRAKRRPTLHCKEKLWEYLKLQSAKEASWMEEHSSSCFTLGSSSPQRATPPRRTVYLDGVFDLFHVGHLHAIQQARALGDRLILGVTGDSDASRYKRPPVIAESDRATIVSEFADQVICPCPLIVDEDFMKKYGIDLVVHGFANEQDVQAQLEFFAVPMKLGKFQRIQYYQDVSTTDIVQKIKHSELGHPNKKGFGTTLAAATRNASVIPYDPFPCQLRAVLEQHFDAARSNRERALSEICKARNITETELQKLTRLSLFMEEDFRFDTTRYSLLSTLLRCTDFPENTNLEQLHTKENGKIQFMKSLRKNFREFQEVFDRFVLEVCAPRMAASYDCHEIYYQSFPCVRMIQPGEFSIGPHADVAYGHHPASSNFYVPMTRISDAASLFLESRPGSEDWHPIEAEYGTVKRFAGAMCLHWTTDNTTDYTRVSIDFRLIAGPLYEKFKFGDALNGGKLSSGYYCCCRKTDKIWQREGDMLSPDARMGYPFTLKNGG